MVEKVKDAMVWVDLEMSGLNINKETILEMACIVTDTNLKPLHPGIDVVINQPNEILENMDDWNKTHHGSSGLIEQVRNSKVSLQQAETMMLDYVQQYVEPRKAILAGNSVHIDKMFLLKYMPLFIDHLHYRIVDVSSFKEMCRRWNPDIFAKLPNKKNAHRALDDILESIQEMQYYKDKLFIQNSRNK